MFCVSVCVIVSPECDYIVFQFVYIFASVLCCHVCNIPCGRVC